MVPLKKKTRAEVWLVDLIFPKTFKSHVFLWNQFYGSFKCYDCSNLNNIQKQIMRIIKKVSKKLQKVYTFFFQKSVKQYPDIYTLKMIEVGTISGSSFLFIWMFEINIVLNVFIVSHRFS